MGTDTDNWSTLQKLVYSKAEKIQSEYDTLLSDSDVYSSNVAWGRVWGFCTKPGMLNKIRSLCVLLTLENACDYVHRVSLLIREFPALLCWLVYKPADKFCPKRMEVAAKMEHLVSNPLNAESNETVSLSI